MSRYVTCKIRVRYSSFVDLKDTLPLETTSALPAFPAKLLLHSGGALGRRKDALSNWIFELCVFVTSTLASPGAAADYGGLLEVWDEWTRKVEDQQVSFTVAEPSDLGARNIDDGGDSDGDDDPCAVLTDTPPPAAQPSVLPPLAPEPDRQLNKDDASVTSEGRAETGPESTTINPVQPASGTHIAASAVEPKPDHPPQLDTEVAPAVPPSFQRSSSRRIML